MPRAIPTGRTTRMSLYSSGGEAPTTFPDGTWIESELFAYPNNTYSRRAYANMPDGSRRVVLCRVADTYFSIPAHARGVKGFLSTDESGIKFTPYDKKDD